MTHFSKYGCEVMFSSISFFFLNWRRQVLFVVKHQHSHIAQRKLQEKLHLKVGDMTASKKESKEETRIFRSSIHLSHHLTIDLMTSNAMQTLQALAMKLFSLLSTETLYESMITTTDLK